MIPATSFARHETFHPRHGWLKKGFDAALDDPQVFLRPDAHVQLGVGKNMARAIRYWCHAFKVLADGPAKGRSSTSLPSVFGWRLLGPDGLDPYVEDPGSLWVLHWSLLREPCLATAWSYTFFTHARPDFNLADLAGGLAEHVARHFPRARAAESSLRKDAACLIRMYGDMPVHDSLTEESIHCPFAEMGILRPSGAPRNYAFRHGRKEGLSDRIIVAACLDFAARSAPGRSSIPIGRLLADSGSPGLAFRLTEDDLYSAIERVGNQTGEVTLADTAGAIQLSFTGPAEQVALEIIAAHYARKEASEVAA